MKIQDLSHSYLLVNNKHCENTTQAEQSHFQACEQFKVIYLKLHSRNNGDVSALLSPFNATLYWIRLTVQ